MWSEQHDSAGVNAARTLVYEDRSGEERRSQQKTTTSCEESLSSGPPPDPDLHGVSVLQTPSFERPSPCGIGVLASAVFQNLFWVFICSS